MDKLKLIEKRKHPRFLLSNELFKETKTGKVFSVYDLSREGLAINIEEPLWKIGQHIQGTLNLHIESIEITAKLLSYYGDRAALKIEKLSTYAKSVLEKALSPKRLGSSLKLIKEALPEADYWFHGVCNTDLFLKFNESKEIEKLDLFFANYYFGYNKNLEKKVMTGLCTSFGATKIESLFLADEPIKMENIDIEHDPEISANKIDWGLGILQAATQLDHKIRDPLLKTIKKIKEGV
jgi:hypothetical protein